MRKYLVAVLAVICLACLAAVAGCDAPNYYSLEWDTPNGITIATDIPENNEVREGVVVSFSLNYTDDLNEYIYDQDNTERVPTVKINNQVVNDSDGMYSFTMSRNTIVEISGMYLPRDFNVTFGSILEYRVDYEIVGSEDKDISSENNTFVYREGSEVSFKVKISSYYNQTGYTVLHNTQVVEPVGEVYTITVNEEKNITVQGLVQDDSFAVRLYKPGDTGYDANNPTKTYVDGAGTAANPFRIRKPIDLFAMASIINNSFFTQYYNCYYRLEENIDMKGEQMFIIGDGLASQTAFFAGNFDGNGKTIHDFYMIDTIVDQESYNNLFIPYIGMFGYAAATTSAPVTISNLTLSDFSIVVDDAAGASSNAFVGGIVGQGIGVNIIGCNVRNASIIVQADDGLPAFVGGLIGYQQSAYQSDTARFYSSIASSSVQDVNITTSGFVYAAGGLCGYMVTADEATPAFVINSYANNTNITFFTGSNLLSAGGIVGSITSYGVIENCYTVNSYIASHSVLDYNTEYNYHISSSGGIVGYANADTLIVNSFVVDNTVTANSSYNSRYSYSDKIAGYLVNRENELPYVSSQAAKTINCLEDGAATPSAITSTLKWNDADWIFTGDYPTVNPDSDPDEPKIITLTLVVANRDNQKFGEKDSITITIENEYLPLSYIYLYYTDYGMTEYVTTDSGLRSFGYFFDAGLTNRISYTYVPIDDMTIYVGVADYKDVLGQYYIDSSTYLLFHDNNNQGIGQGLYTYFHNSVVFTATYIYDGNTLTLYSCPLFSTSEGFISTLAVKTEEGLSIYGNGSYTVASPLVAHATIANMQYGEYYDENGGIYTFYADKTGTYQAVGGTTTTFTYIIDAGNIVTNTSITCTVEDGLITKYGTTDIKKFDDFKGTWESEATLNQEFVVDGKGNWSLTQYEYIDGVKTAVSGDTISGKYALATEVVDKVTVTYLTLGLNNATSGEATAQFNANGYLDITRINIPQDNNTTLEFYRESSFVGTWTFPSRANEPVTLNILGRGFDGIGHATATFDVNRRTFDLTYDVDGDELTFYYRGTIFGELEYSSETMYMSGEFYSISAGYTVTGRAFFLTDSFYGTWFNNSDGSTIYFNGNGLYNQASSSTHMAVRSGVRLSGGTSRTYTLTNGNMVGTFTNLGTNYTIEYMPGTDTLVLSVLGANNVPESTQYYHRADALMGMRLYTFSSESMSSYVFDGNGTLTVTTTYADGRSSTPATATYKYSILTDGSIVEFTFNNSLVGTITIAVVDNITTYTLTLAEQTTEITMSTVSTTPDKMWGETLYSTTATSNSTYSFSGNGILTIVTQTTSPSPATTTTIYDYTVLSNGNLQLSKESEEEGEDDVIVGIITITTVPAGSEGGEATTTYSLKMGDEDAITLTTTASLS